MSSQKSKKIRLTVFLASLCLPFFLSTVQASALETQSMDPITARNAEAENEDGKKEEVLQLEINDPTAVVQLKEYILSNDINYQLSNKSLEEMKMDAENATITTGTLDIMKYGVQEIDVTLTLNCTSDFNSMMVYPITKKVKVEFVDTTAPTISLTRTTVNVTKNGTFNPDKYLSDITDNGLSQDVRIEVISNIDCTELGSYEVTYKATDEFGNISEEVLTVSVVNKKVVEAPAATAYSVSASDDVMTMLALINQERAANGIHELVLGDDAGMLAAAIRAEEAAGYVSHTRPNGTSYKTALDECGVSYGTTGEVLTYSGSTLYDKFNWWMNSSGHRSKLLSGSYSTIVIANYGGLWVAILY